ncbi:MAG: glycosyltransferase [Anaerolineae bacterium]|nr:glycosyltransferase [Thermoflexales bacterium]MDW8407431.1 glycosyltransferase [Anaerolineae bacterium]
MVMVAALIGWVMWLVVRDMRRLLRWTQRELNEQNACAASDGCVMDASARPAMSVVVPARNEASTIARCLDGLLNQTLQPREIIVVDDHSTDATPHILNQYARRHPDRIVVISGRPLPPGWVGKCNACQQGAIQAGGDWLLFLDADTVPQPTLLQAILCEAERDRLDALSVFPFNELGTLAERLILPAFFQFAWTVFPAAQMHDPEMPWHTVMANGQCFLFRTNVYRAVGGHACVKDQILEDVMFAQTLRRAGYRVGVRWGGQHIRVRMYRSGAEIVQGLAKHAWAGRQAGGRRAYWGVARLLLTTLAPPLALILTLLQMMSEPNTLHAIAAFIAALGYGASWVFWRESLRRLYRLPAWLTALMPIGALGYLLIALKGITAVAFRRGVQWKGRSYL